METYAIHKTAMIKPRLARMTMDLIRGKDVETAKGAEEKDLVISKCFINPGPIYKRIQFASRGNVDRHDKRTSHIVVYVTDNKEASK